MRPCCLIKTCSKKKVEHQDKSILTVYFDFWIFPDFDAKNEENEYNVHSYSLSVCFCQGSRKIKPTRFWRRKNFCDKDKTLLEAFFAISNQWDIGGTHFDIFFRTLQHELKVVDWYFNGRIPARVCELGEIWIRKQINVNNAFWKILTNRILSHSSKSWKNPINYTWKNATFVFESISFELNLVLE